MKIFRKEIHFYIFFLLFIFLNINLVEAKLIKNESKPLKKKSMLIVASELDASEIEFKKSLDDFVLFMEEQFRLVPGLQVVKSKNLKEYLKYHRLDIISQSELVDGEVYLAKAKSSWFEKDYIGAKSFVDKAINQFVGRKENGDLLVDAYLTKIIILEKLKLKNDIKSIVSLVLEIDPYINFEELPLAQFSKINFNKAQKEHKEFGTIQISSIPPGAIVKVNGRDVGTTPVHDYKLPIGPYTISVEANHYQNIVKNIFITSGTEQVLEAKLKWNYHKKNKQILLGVPGKTDKELQSDIKKIVQIGKRTKVDHVLWLTPQSYDGTENLVMRLIDTNLEASFNPISIPIASILNNEKKDFIKVNRRISRSFRSPVLNHPSKYLDPDYGQVQTLRKPMRWYQNPAVLTGIGAAIIGGVIYGLNQGGSSSTQTNEGIVEVGFEGL